MKAAHHAAKGHAKKHAHASKHVHHKHPKHNPKHHKPAHHQHHKAKVKTVGFHHNQARGLAVSPGDVACCVSQALAASLRLQGLPVSGADVLALHRAADADDDRGAPIWAVLEAASEVGLGGARLLQQRHIGPVDTEALCGQIGVPCGELGIEALEGLIEAAPHLSGELFGHALILGVDLPGPHAVLATAEGWWSWGELFCPWCEWPDAVVDEAWAVSWR